MPRPKGTFPVTDDTASITDADLRDLGIDAPSYVYGLLIVWSLEEWRRIGEVSLFESLAHWISVGRGEDSRAGHRRALWLRQRPGEHAFTGPLGTSTCSADQLLVKAVADGLELHNVGKNPMVIDGKVVTRAFVRPGQLVTLAGQFMFMVVRRPLPMPPPRHFNVKHWGPFGEANAFGAVGECEVAHELNEQLAFAAKSRAHVVLAGETGTGKESCGKGIHGMGPDADGPWAPISVGSLARSLLEDQLFGHEDGYPQKGDKARPGVVGEANGGSLFFDELGRLSFDMQVALLRLLDEGQYKPLGATGVRYSRFKLIGAMSGMLTDLTKDLRGRVRIIHLPRLVDRREDIPLLVRDWLKKKHAETEDGDLTKHLLRKQADGSEELVPPIAFIDAMLRRETFAGNVRELQEAVDEMLYRTKPPPGDGVTVVREQGEGSGRDGADGDEARGRGLTKQEIEGALERQGGSVSGAARVLGVTRQSLYRAMQRVGVKGKGG
jgi:two-component system nitrogen regulation response regulator GlnG/two-component system response regulator HydG